LAQVAGSSPLRSEETAGSKSPALVRLKPNIVRPGWAGTLGLASRFISRPPRRRDSGQGRVWRTQSKGC